MRVRVHMFQYFRLLNNSLLMKSCSLNDYLSSNSCSAIQLNCMITFLVQVTKVPPSFCIVSEDLTTQLRLTRQTDTSYNSFLLCYILQKELHNANEVFYSKFLMKLPKTQSIFIFNHKQTLDYLYLFTTLSSFASLITR